MRERDKNEGGRPGRKRWERRRRYRDEDKNYCVLVVDSEDWEEIHPRKLHLDSCCISQPQQHTFLPINF